MSGSREEKEEKVVQDGTPENGEKEEAEKDSTYRIRFRPARDIFANGTNPVALLEELREIGACSIVAHHKEIPVLEEMDPEACYTSWDIILTTEKGLIKINQRKKHKPNVKSEQSKLKTKRIIEIFHQKPKMFGINRSNWNRESIKNVYEKQYGEKIGNSTVGCLINNLVSRGFRKLVLISVS